MGYPPRPWPPLAATSMLAATLCVACQPLDAGAGEADGSRGSPPPMYVRLHWEDMSEDGNAEQARYTGGIEACQQAGIATRALSADEVERLGTGVVEITMDSHGQRVRQVAWALGYDGNDGSVEASCRFVLVEDREEEKVAFHDEEADIEPGPFAVQSSGSVPGWTRLGDDSVGGQPCRRWRKADELGAPEEVCVWSAGLEWGFGDGPTSTLGCDIVSLTGYLGALPLEGKPLEGAGCAVTLQSFSIGRGVQPDRETTLTGPEGEA